MQRGKNRRYNQIYREFITKAAVTGLRTTDPSIFGLSECIGEFAQVHVREVVLCQQRMIPDRNDDYIVHVYNGTECVTITVYYHIIHTTVYTVPKRDDQ